MMPLNAIWKINDTREKVTFTGITGENGNAFFSGDEFDRLGVWEYVCPRAMSIDMNYDYCCRSSV